MVPLNSRAPDATGAKADGQRDPATLYHLGYVSTQTRPMTSADLLALLTRAREANSKRNVTGLLLHREDSFFQVIEGAEQEVLAVFEQVKRDPRHQRVEVLFQGACDKREFSDWRMGFIELDGIDVSALPGFSSFLVDDAEPRHLLRELTRTQRLMLLFRAMS
jgi:hypothetical protein